MYVVVHVHVWFGCVKYVRCVWCVCVCVNVHVVHVCVQFLAQTLYCIPFNGTGGVLPLNAGQVGVSSFKGGGLVVILSYTIQSREAG